MTRRGVLARIRYRLAVIEYCSAKPPQTRWSWWLGVNLWLSLLAAFPAALVADSAIVRESPTGAMEEGQMWIDPGPPGTPIDSAALRARLVATGGRTPTWSDARPYATFSVRPLVRWRGWPASSRDEQPLALLRIVPLEGLQARRPDAEERAAIAQVLREAGRPELAERAAAGASGGAKGPVRMRWGALSFNALVLWPVIAAIGAVLVGLCAAGDAFLRVRGARIRRDRIRRGICPVCRYDIRGSVWTSQCPECGELIY